MNNFLLISANLVMIVLFIGYHVVKARTPIVATNLYCSQLDDYISPGYPMQSYVKHEIKRYCDDKVSELLNDLSWHLRYLVEFTI